MSKLLGSNPQVIYDAHAGLTRFKPRTWRERLFSWPWRPWVAKTEFVEPAIFVAGGTYGTAKYFIAHPVFKRLIEEGGVTEVYGVFNESEFGKRLATSNVGTSRTDPEGRSYPLHSPPPEGDAPAGENSH